MITNREAAIRQPLQSATETGSARAPQAATAQAVIEAYTAAVRRRAAAETPFDAATRAYIVLNPGISRDLASRAVAEIISHSS